MTKVSIIYASGQGKTKLMAETMAEGVKTIKDIDVVLKSSVEAGPEDVADADAILLGGSTYNYQLNKAMGHFLKEMESLDLKGKIGIAFGSYGWSGEGVPTIIENMKSFGMNVIEPGISVKQSPDEKAIEECFKMGITVAQGL